MLLLICVFIFANGITAFTNSTLSKNSSCRACAGQVPLQRQPVCGSDNQTYPSRCHLLQAQCHGVKVTVLHRGRCKESQPCWAELDYLRRRTVKVAAFIPTCLDDGNYAAVQCYDKSGYCWCVTPSGHPLTNSSVRYSRPKCDRRGYTSPRRRSSRNRKNNRVCQGIDRSTFNKKMIMLLKTEYSRRSALSSSNTRGLSSVPNLNKFVLDWKFSQLDTNSDGMLEKQELKDFRRLVRKIMKPRRCARSFRKQCDIDNDQFLSREEWNSCLATGFNHILHSSGGSITNKRRVLQSRVSPLPSQLPHSFGEDSGDRLKEETEVTDCITDRKVVLDEQKNGNTQFYVPECLPDGRYKKIQCYSSTGYCWCVNQDNGKPIPGTSVKDEAPKCDAVQVPARPMNGCPEPRKRAFLKELMNFLTLKMAESKNKTNFESSTPHASDSSWNMPPEEHIATWNFIMLDKNKNKVLERKEWKYFRELVSVNVALRRCGKRLPRYCDVNHDRKISITEWLNCLNASSTANTVSSTPSNRRKGLNPLQAYLKGDD